MAPVRERIRAYNSAVHAIAEHYDCYLVSFWEVAAYDDDRLWDEDRLHLSPAGHRLAARTALEALGLGDPLWRTPEVPAPRPARTGAGGVASAVDDGTPRAVGRTPGAWGVVR